MAAYLLSLKKTKVDISFTWCCMGSFMSPCMSGS
jgi:hypothetical protein